MNKIEHDKIIDLMKHGALHGIDTGRLDDKCEDVIPIEDAIAIVDLIYKEESENSKKILEKRFTPLCEIHTTPTSKNVTKENFNKNIGKFLL